MADRFERERFEIALPDINKRLFFNMSHVYTRSQFNEELENNRSFWRLSEAFTTNKFIDLLIEFTGLRKVRVGFPNRGMVRYVYGEPSIFNFALSLETDSYLTHFSALYLNDLTEQIPKYIYVNKEQSKKLKNKSDLEQGRIDNAFRNTPRLSNNNANYDDHLIFILNGMFTGELGVERREGANNETILVTNVERTLIDCVVRPFYAGGVNQVLNAFRLAEEKVQLNNLSAMLKKLDYVYPYHQAIGFCLERSGVYSDSLIDIFASKEMKFDFFLTHKMGETEYSKKWRLFYPKGL